MDNVPVNESYRLFGANCDNEDLRRRVRKKRLAFLLKILLGSWKDIIGCHFKPRERTMLQPPNFAIGQEKSMLGSYDATSNTISISEELIDNHPWYAVDAVLRHEIAHQLTHAWFMYHDDLNEEGPHGPVFRQMCGRLGADPSARVEMLSLDAQIFQEEGGGSQSGQVFSKIRKLLVMAEKGTEHEAEVALAKALEIMDRNGLSRDDLEGEGEFVTIHIGLPSSTVKVFDRFLASILGEFWHVSTLLTYEPALSSDDEHGRVCWNYGNTLSVSGTRVNVKIAAYVYDYIWNFINQSWRQYCGEHGIAKPGVRMFRDYTIGIITGFGDKLRRSKVMLNGEAEALALRHDALLEGYTAKRYPHVSHISRKAVKMNKEIYEAGKETGKDLEVHSGLEHEGRRLALKE